MKITFIRPNLYPRRSNDALEPIVFAILRGLTPSDTECVLYDERLEDIPLDEETDLVAMTVETFTARRAYQIAAHFVQRDIPVVMGGYHPTLCPDEALQFATSIVVGDAESVWPNVLRDLQRGGLRRVYRGQQTPLDELRVDRSIFAGKAYRPVALVQYGRGCRYACDFCSIHAFYGRNLRWRPIENVVQELGESGRRFVFITDDNLFNDTKHLEVFLDAIRPLRIHWSCQASIDVASDPQLVRKMSDSGCMSVMVGFESLDSDNLAQMRKTWQLKYGSFEERISVFRDHGIMVYGGFVLGYDHDGPDSFKRSLDFAIRNQLLLANFNPLAPTPGTPLYDRLKREDRLLNDPWWLHSDFRYGDSMFRPRRMSPEQLMEGCYWARTQFNRWSAIARRGLDLRANLRNPLNAAAFVLANITSRREIHRKQGCALGDEQVPVTPLFRPDDEYRKPLTGSAGLALK